LAFANAGPITVNDTISIKRSLFGRVGLQNPVMYWQLKWFVTQF